MRRGTIHVRCVIFFLIKILVTVVVAVSATGTPTFGPVPRVIVVLFKSTNVLLLPRLRKIVRVVGLRLRFFLGVDEKCGSCGRCGSYWVIL